MSVAGIVVALVVIGCSVSPSSQPTTMPTPGAMGASAQATTVSSSVTHDAIVAAPGQKIIWGKIWNCGCHDRDGADSVTAELQVENLPSDFKERVPVGQYDYFAISFDPAVIDQNRLENAIKTAGGKIVQGLPTSANE